ncbi:MULTISPECIES: ABC transporter ATP-binding protein [unclassified Neisseria]|uniref:ABC transporter ATP-binding protein n=1 Tax=unclassified Neisseria TaxID=2623750 RepID=UPI001072C61D|nr:MULTISPECIES: ABC transporter ATP-binding protein [unclassified Neisseria]MBF0803272.1 ABC transporter ATP-binding protein [Neisseria sp. 19428wB4_WF04]TFU44110.1 ABC transporter ATP-binding protein [Neisseria sp. WF04]
MDNLSFSIRNLTVSACSKILLRVEALDIPHGCHTAVIGPNGAGKSTLLKALIGQAGQGEITLFEQAVAPRLKQSKVAWVGQHGSYRMPLSVHEYITFGQKSSGKLFQTAAPLPLAAQELLEVFDLAGLPHKRVYDLSGGEQQRANIARALLQNTPVLLLDEPCNHLDIRHQHSLIRSLNRQTQRFSALMVLHDLNLAAQYAQHIVLLNQGRVIAAGAPEAVMRPELLAEVYQWPIRRVCGGGQVYFSS